MTTVPKGKTLYIGARRFVEGEILPPHLAIDLPVDRREKFEDYEKPKRSNN